MPESPGPARLLPERDLERPLRVVLFGGVLLDPGALDLMALLDEHPEVDFLGGFCQSPGFGWRHQVADIVARRQWLAPAVLAAHAGRALGRYVRDAQGEARRRRRTRGPRARIVTVRDIHDSAVLQRVRALDPDLGLVYGSPVLRAELFQTPRFGTIGIHHGSLPQYRGKKTTFWAMFNGEPSAGVAIQRIGSGIDTGAILSTGTVSTVGKRYGRVEAELERLGVQLYLATVLSVKRGEAVARPQASLSSPLYRDPRSSDLLRFWWKQLLAGRSSARTPRQAQ